MTQRRHFGSTRKLSSGRWQARYFDAAGTRHNAPRHVRVEDRRTAVALDGRRRPRTRRLARPQARRDVRSRAVGRALASDDGEPSAVDARPVRVPAARAHPPDVRLHARSGQITTVDVQAWLVDRRNAGLSANERCQGVPASCPHPASARSSRDTSPRTRARIRGAGTNGTPEMAFATPEQVAVLADVDPTRVPGARAHRRVLVAAVG